MSQRLDQSETRQERMIREQVIDRGVRDPRVLAAMRAIPRAEFFQAEQLENAYADGPSPIGFGQTISQPYIVALMTTNLQLDGNERVLEIGTGSGYQTAILAKTAGEIFTIERVKGLLDVAWERLMRLNLRNIRYHFGDGTLGWPDQSMNFDRVIVSAGAPSLPKALLLSQLRDGGIAILPVGSVNEQMLVCIHRRGSKLIEKQITPVRFVKLVGKEGWAEP